MSDEFQRGPAPVNPLPVTVVVLFLAMFMIECIFAAGEAGIIGGPEAIGWRLTMVREYGFSPDIFDWMIANGSFPTEHLLRFVTYPFLHLGFIHMAFAGVILLAMGKVVGESFGPLSVFIIFFVSSIMGALAYGAFLNEQTWLTGGYPGAYGLIGGFTYVLWLRLGQTGETQVQAFSLIAFLMGIQLVFGLLFGADNTWVADLAGFAAGFAAAVVLRPGALPKLLERLRQRR